MCIARLVALRQTRTRALVCAASLGEWSRHVATDARALRLHTLRPVLRVGVQLDRLFAVTRRALFSLAVVAARSGTAGVARCCARAVRRGRPDPSAFRHGGGGDLHVVLGALTIFHRHRLLRSLPPIPVPCVCRTRLLLLCDVQAMNHTRRPCPRRLLRSVVWVRCRSLWDMGGVGSVVLFGAFHEEAERVPPQGFGARFVGRFLR
mmetsp:Transcript_13594/g.23299  ORF Transcript_13594/g.23299 Transcript_13594/m.23299 type:complete len:206 (-) Transcript_13594:928-1545(-)